MLVCPRHKVTPRIRHPALVLLCILELVFLQQFEVLFVCPLYFSTHKKPPEHGLVWFVVAPLSLWNHPE